MPKAFFWLAERPARPVRLAAGVIQAERFLFAHPPPNQGVERRGTPPLQCKRRAQHWRGGFSSLSPPCGGEGYSHREYPP